MNIFNGIVVSWFGSKAAAQTVAAVLVISLAGFSLAATAQTGENEHPRRNSTRAGSFHMEGVQIWFRNKFSDSELDTYQPEDFRIESHACNCSDRPVPHYPYLLVFFSTPKGDLVGRPDRRGFDTVITPLAVRHGERYCEIDAEDQCYGSFANPCDFTDFRYGNQLAPYFPTCKPSEPEPS